MSFYMDAKQAIEWTMRFAAIFILFDSAEKLYQFGEFKDEGALSWNALRKSRYFASRPKAMLRLLDIVFEYRVWLIILMLRLLGALALLVLPQQSAIAAIALLTLFITCSLMNFRNGPLRAETENRLGLMIIGALLLRSIAPTAITTLAALWFIALQSCFSYITAGIVKLVQPVDANEKNKHIYRNLLLAMSRRRVSSHQYFFVKFTSHNILFFSFIHSVFPGVPAIFLTRDAEKIVASFQKRPPGWLNDKNPNILKMLSGSGETNLKRIVRDFLACAAGQPINVLRPIEYEMLKAENLPFILSCFNINPDETQVELMKSQFAFDSKVEFNKKPFEG